MKQLFKYFAPIILLLSMIGIADANNQTAQYFDINQISPVENVSKTEAFNGELLYKEAVKSVVQYHVNLADQTKRAQWQAEWLTKYDGSDQLRTEKGTDKAIREMLRSLGQRYDFYLDAKQRELEKEAMQGNFVGIGVSIGFKNKIKPEDIADPSKGPLISEDKHVEVKEEPFENSPAEAAGVQKGDVFKEINSKSVLGLTIGELVERIRGPEGSTVNVTFERAGNDLTVEIVRKRVKMNVVKFTDLGEGISHIKLMNFESKDVTKDMYEALVKASSGKALILDLRNNPGGHLSTAHNVLEMLLPEGTATALLRREGDGLVIETQAFLMNIKVASRTGPDGRTNVEAQPRRQLMIPHTMPIVVLVNEFSASASEIVSGALSYSNRAVIVGKNTVGKGVGQVVLPLPFNRSVHITTFEFRPSGIKMDWAGVAPDHVVELDDSLNYDNQLRFAQELASELAKKQMEKESRLGEAESKHREEFEKTQAEYEKAKLKK